MRYMFIHKQKKGFDTLLYMEIIFFYNSSNFEEIQVVSLNFRQASHYPDIWLLC